MTRVWIRSWMQLAALGVLLGLPAACVWRTEHKVETVHKIDAHIVLDVRQIQADAHEVEGYVRADENGTPPKLEGTPTSFAVEPARKGLLERVLSVFDPATTAMAAEDEKLVPSIRMSEVTPDAERRAIEQRKKRGKTINEALSKKIVGETDRGYLDLRLPKDHPNKEERARWLDLVREENRDRKIIYLATVRKRELEENQLGVVEVIFAEVIRKELKPGQLFQAPRDKEFFDAFKKSELGRKYPDARPGQWLEKK